MSNFKMITGTYTNYYNLMEKIRDSFVECGWTVLAFKENIVNTAGLKKGFRLHVSKNGVYIALAGADNGIPTASSSTWVANSVKGICFQISNVDTSNDLRWWNSSLKTSTSQVSENNSYFIFIKDDGFLLCCRFTARRYSFMNFLTNVGYDKTKKYQIAAGSYNRVNSEPDYETAWSALPNFPFISDSDTTGSNNITISGAQSGTIIEVNTKEFVNNYISGHFFNSSVNNSTTVGSTILNLGYGKPSQNYSRTDSNIINRTKTPFSESYIPLPIEIFSGSRLTVCNKLFLMRDIYIICMKNYEAEQIFNIGKEQFIVLPFFEKSSTNVSTMYFGYNMGIAVKIGEV